MQSEYVQLLLLLLALIYEINSKIYDKLNRFSENLYLRYLSLVYCFKLNESIKDYFIYFLQNFFFLYILSKYSNKNADICYSMSHNKYINSPFIFFKSVF